MARNLNQRTFDLLNRYRDSFADLKIKELTDSSGGKIVDFGVSTVGSLEGGLLLARLCLSDLGAVNLFPLTIPELGLPTVQVITDQPLLATLASQYAGWAIQTDSFFGMGSGPIRAHYGQEDLFSELKIDEKAEEVFGVIECSKLPNSEVFQWLSDKIDLPPEKITLAVTPTSSLAGYIQIVARSVETALHKLHELDFDLHRIVSGYGIAPLPPVAKDDVRGIGKTNDSILYGSQVTLWVKGDDASLEKIGPSVPSSASKDYGSPFKEIFDSYNQDFYKIDPALFSPAKVNFQNLDTGRTLSFGNPNIEVLKNSFYA